MVPKLPAAHSARKLPNFHQLGELWASIHRKDCRKIDSPLARRFEFSKIGRSDTRENLCSPFCARRNHKYERRKERARARFSISRQKFSAHLPIMYPLCSSKLFYAAARPRRFIIRFVLLHSFRRYAAALLSAFFFLLRVVLIYTGAWNIHAPSRGVSEREGKIFTVIDETFVVNDEIAVFMGKEVEVVHDRFSSLSRIAIFATEWLRNL